MKINYLLLIFLLISIGSASAQTYRSKQAFDIDRELSGKMKSGSLQDDAINLTNTSLEMLLMKDGYFTIGTNTGTSASLLDDKCQITFGHPYSLTSFPVFVIDGVEQNAKSFFANSTQQLTGNNNSITLIASDNGMFISTFNMSFTDAATIRLTTIVEFTDNTEHSIASGYLLDPALGRYGDGAFYLQENEITAKTLINSDMPSEFEIWEKSGIAKGLGIKIQSIENAPASIEIDNWLQMNNQSISETTELYDIAVKILNNERIVQNGEKYSYSIEIQLLEPDFGNAVFARWDAPSFLSIENNMPFPSHLKTYFEVHNTGSQTIDNLSFKLNGNEYINDIEATNMQAIEALSTGFISIPLTFDEIYEDEIIPVELSVLQNNEVIFSIKKNIFCPASPFSDEGLEVIIDSVYYAEDGTMQISFRVKNEETGQLIYDLKKTNLFFYTDGERYEPVLEKDTTGGLNQADIVFVLDVTGSMGGEINDVKNNVVEFADNLKENGIDYQLGMVTFLDEIENIYDFTKDEFYFKDIVGQQFAHGGGDGPENSLEGLMNATFFNFRPSANRIVVWITDAEYHYRTQYTLDDVIEGMLQNGITVHCVGSTNYQTGYYDQIIMNTGGNFYDINGNFRDILIDISKMQSSGKFIIKLPKQDPSPTEITVEIHYAGLGGKAIIPLSNKKVTTLVGNAQISCFPNPFITNTTIFVKNPDELSGSITIFDTKGMYIEKINIPAGEKTFEWQWNTNDKNTKSLPDGMYLVKLAMYNTDGSLKELNISKMLLTR